MLWEAGRRAAAAIDRPFEVERIRRDFPILSRSMRGKPLVFLDSAASAQKPQAVIDAIAGEDARESTRASRCLLPHSAR